MIYSDFPKNIRERSGFFEKGNIQEPKRKTQLILNLENRSNQLLIIDDIFKSVFRDVIEILRGEKGFSSLQNNSEKLNLELGLVLNSQILSCLSFEDICISTNEKISYINLPQFIEFTQNDSTTSHSIGFHNPELKSVSCSPLLAGSKNLGKLKTKERSNSIKLLANKAI